jgi:hypothetical protein
MSRMDPPGFVLQFDSAEIPALAARFGALDAPGPMAMGAAARERGFYERREFVALCRWKTPRSGPHVAKNSATAVRAATSLALRADEAAEQAAHLLILRGVGMPTASVLLHFAFPESRAILDVRALEALGVKRSSYTPAFFAAYCEACRALAARHDVSLRTLDRALWQWSKEAG